MTHPTPQPQVSEEPFNLVISGFNGNPHHCVYINNFRLVGGKPWGGGNTTARWTFTLKELQRAFPDLEIRNKKEIDLSAPPARQVDVESLIEAVWQVLDDMGAEGACVCEAAKAKLRIAYEPFNDHEAEPDYAMDTAQSLARVRDGGK